MAYTPGPWRVKAQGGEITVGWSNSKEGVIWSPIAIAINSNGETDVLANAFLMAAAPEMYEALKKVLQVYDPDEAVVPIRSILRKARGRRFLAAHSKENAKEQ